MRYWFGGTPADWTFGVGADGALLLAGGISVMFFTARVGGVQLADLLDADGKPITQVTSGDGTSAPTGTLPPIQGPPDVTGMWADAGAGVRFWMPATSLGDTIADLQEIAQWAQGFRELLTSGQPGQYLTRDPDPAAPFSVRWAEPPSTGLPP